jgi:thiol:disulfide interchange protein DsbA
MRIGMLTLGCAACFVLAFSQHVPCEPQLNVEYKLVEAPNLAGRDGSLRIVEFFWYGCPYCREFEPLFTSWAARNAARVTVDFRPVALQGNLAPGAKTFHALKQMGLEGRFHDALLAATAAEEVDVTLFTSIASWLGAHGVDRQEFEQVYNSQRVADAFQESVSETAALGITSMPSMVVNGRYLTSTDAAKGYSNTLDVLDYLLAGMGASVASPEALSNERQQKDVSNNPEAACSTCEVGSPAVTLASYPRLSPFQLRDMLRKKNFFLVNVHVPYEGEIEGTDAFIAYDSTARRIGEYPSDKNANIVIYCKSNRMADEAAQELAALGYTGVSILDGGMTAWMKAGFSLKNRETGSPN